MRQVKAGTLERVPAMARLISELNSDSAHHVGYCGTEEEEIEHSIQEEFGEYELDHYVTLLYEQEQLIGLLLLDADEEEGQAELWGPFIIKGDWGEWQTAADQLWAASLAKLSPSIQKIAGFYHIHNHHAFAWMETKQAVKQGQHTILKLEELSGQQLVIDQIDNQKLKIVDIGEIMSSSSELPIPAELDAILSSFYSLHNECFPSTYYDSGVILSRLAEDNRLFICLYANELAGYVYLEGSREFREGQIEYIAVRPDRRGHRIGLYLLHHALQHLFGSIKVKEVSLCVNNNNPAAISLYHKAGFHTASELQYISLHR